MNYHPVITKNQTNSNVGFQDTEKAGGEGTQTYVLFLVLSDGFTNSQHNNKDALVDGKEHDDNIQKTNDFSDASPSNATMPNVEDLTHSNDADDVGVEADINNLESIFQSVLFQQPESRMIIQPLKLLVICLQLLKPEVWQEQFEIKRAIGTKWVYRNKKDERGIVIRNKARLVAQGHTKEEGIDYEEVFVPVARIEAIRLFLAYASFMGFPVYQMDVKSAFLYGTIEEEVYVCQPLGFEDPENPDKVYKVVKVLYGLHQAHRAWYETLATYLLENRFHRG
nr:putative reverse transcriptase, RNA-dependent DNA polymerase [Tanacetum cinerariifolium]